MTGLAVPNTIFQDEVTRVVSQWLQPVNDAMNFVSGLVGLNAAGNFSIGTGYVVNDYVIYSNQLYKCIAGVAPAVTTPNADPTHWTPLLSLSPVNTAQIANIAALRLATSVSLPTSTVLVHGYYSSTITSAPDGGGGVFIRDDADSTTTDDGGTVIVDASGRRWKRQYSSQADARWFGAKIDGAANDTTALANWVAADINGGTRSLYLPAGATLTTALSLNGASQPANNQWNGISTMYGEGRFQSVITATGSYSPGTFVVTGHNLSGISIRNIGFDGAGIADSGLNLAWLGGSSGNPALAPSNQNVLENVFVQGCSAFGMNLDTFQDSKISGLWIRAVSSTGIGLSLQGGGGQIVASDVWVSSGLTRISCQNGSFDRCGFFGGLQLSGSSYNQCAFNGVQFIPDPTTGSTINSTATGNATRGCVFNGCYFNSQTYVVRGRWHQGATFIGCQFQSWTAFADNANFSPAGGSGQVPTFIFQNCSFESAAPTSQAGLYNVVIIACRNTSGQVITDYGNIYSTGTVNLLSNNAQLGVGAQTFNNRALNLTNGSFFDVVTGRGTFFLAVNNYIVSSADHATHTTYHCSIIDADANNQVIQLATSNGSGGGATFTVTFPAADTVRFTNTSGSTTNLTVAMFGTSG